MTVFDLDVWTPKVRDFFGDTAVLSLPYLSLALVVGGALILHRIAFRVLRRMAKPESFARLAFGAIRRPTRLAFVAIALSFGLSVIDLPFGIQGDLRHLSVILFILMAGWAIKGVASLSAELTLRKYKLGNEDNLRARQTVTQVRILNRMVQITVIILTIGAALLTFDSVKRYGVSLLASAGAAGIVLGFAARPVLTNLIAGIQIALTQPIRIDDVVIVENEWGWIEDIGTAFVTVRLWDWRRMILPLSYFVEKPFQNWTRESSAIIGSVFWQVDYTVPVEEMREKLQEFVEGSERWDGKVCNLQVVEATEQGLKLRGLMSSRNSPINWDLRCEIREKMVTWLREDYPEALPRLRAEMVAPGGLDTAGTAGGSIEGPNRSSGDARLS
jgi:small-conductance mechanosensitive channel